MNRFTSSLVAGLIAIAAAACSHDVASPSALLSQGADNGTGASSSTAIKTITEIVLTGSAGFPQAEGKAKFTMKGAQRELEIEVEDIAALAGSTVTFSLGGTAVGTAVVDALGHARLSLSTKNGNTVPASVAGLAVEVRTAANALIASGSF